ncbi:MAG: glycosyltransferase family 4 protein [Vicinamibacteria bacterium]|nr:glycosyltransferase family 4 protein [Vicinamibacteria bacterium]
MRIDQWIPALHKGDAVGDSALLMRDTIRRWGLDADVYALEIDQCLEGDGRRFAEWRDSGTDDIVILHYALPSPLTPALKRHGGRRVLLYHNITPPESFLGFDEEMARICIQGRRDLASLKDDVDLALAVSEFNRRDLVQAGFGRTAVLPIQLDFARYRKPPNPILRRTLDDGLVNILFVGRVSPNKCHADLIRVAAYWKRYIAPNVRLLLVGKLPRFRRYFDALQSFFYELGFTPWEIVFTGHVEHDDLLAYYTGADVFLSMSAHEGFGVPFLEAMLLDVPVLAYKAAAVGETLGGAGLAFTRKEVAEVAETAYLLVTNAALRESVLAGQRRRVRAFAPENVASLLRRHIESL